MGRLAYLGDGEDLPIVVDVGNPKEGVYLAARAGYAIQIELLAVSF